MACSASREAEAGRVSASRAGGHAPRTRERVARKSASAMLLRNGQKSST